jgi:hypothetical protein
MTSEEYGRPPLSAAAAESAPAHEADRLRTILRHARIPAERAAEFWDRVEDLAREFAQLPRSGDTVYGFAASLYPTDYPTLPDPDDETGEGISGRALRQTRASPSRSSRTDPTFARSYCPSWRSIVAGTASHGCRRES